MPRGGPKGYCAMDYYLTDNPWPLMVLFGGLMVVFLISGSPGLRRMAAVPAVVAAAVFAVSEFVVSPAEQIEQAADRILQGFQAGDLDAIAQVVSADSPELLSTASRGLDLVTIGSDFHIRSVDILSESDDRIVARIRANGTVTTRGQSVRQHVPEFWETTWVRETDGWKLTDATRLHPLTGKPRGTFDPQ